MLNKNKAKIQCRKCRNDKFELRFVVVDGVKSLIIHCKCGRTVEYRGFQEIIVMTPDVKGEEEVSEREASAWEAQGEVVIGE